MYLVPRAENVAAILSLVAADRPMSHTAGARSDQVSILLVGLGDSSARDVGLENFHKVSIEFSSCRLGSWKTDPRALLPECPTECPTSTLHLPLFAAACCTLYFVLAEVHAIRSG